MKKILSVLLAIVMMFSVFSVCLVSNASEASDEESIVMPRFTTIAGCTYLFEIKGLTAKFSVSLDANRYTNLKITVEMQREESTGYKTVETWTASETNYVALSLGGSRIINPFADYRIKITFVAGTETHIVYDYPA